METYSYEKVLPSCTLNRGLLTDIEKRLLFGIPKLMQKGLNKVVQGLGLEDYKKIENYQIIVDNGKETSTLVSAKQMACTYFESRTRQVSVFYKLGAPQLLTIEINFPQNGRPCITMTTQSPQVEKLLPRIADGISAGVNVYGNRHKTLHNSFIQGALLLTVPAMVMSYGLYSGIDLFLLYSSMGWLCLISLGIIRSLPYLFPWVTFEKQRRFQFRRLPLLAKFSLLSVAAACYVGLVLLNMPRADEPATLLLAGIIG